MKPSELSSRLREIADRIDRSERPSVALVARALRETVAAVDPNWKANQMKDALEVLQDGSITEEELKALPEQDRNDLLKAARKVVLERKKKEEESRKKDKGSGSAVIDNRPESTQSGIPANLR